MRILGQGRSGEGSLAAVKYETALRVIGQDLTPLLLQSVEITVENNAFVAQGAAPAAGRGANAQKEPARQPFVRRYSAQDIQRLNEQGRRAQAGGAKTPDASSLAESLRTIGRALDLERRRLVQVVKDGHKFTVVYEDEKGEAHRDECYSLSLYKGQQDGLSRRGKKKDIWEDSKG
jgi:hypothetical protein